MHRTDADGNVAGLFTDGDPMIPQEATVIGAAWLNDIQEEICNAIEDLGGTLVKGNQTQLYDRLVAVFGRLASANTWSATQTVNADVSITVTAAGTGTRKLMLTVPVTAAGVKFRLYYSDTGALVATFNAVWDNGTSQYTVDVVGVASYRMAAASGTTSFRTYTAPDANPFAESAFNTLSVLVSPGDVTVTGDLLYSPVKTGYIYVTPYDFELEDTNSRRVLDGGASPTIHYLGSSTVADVFYHARVFLPGGATITNAETYIQNSNISTAYTPTFLGWVYTFSGNTASRSAIGGDLSIAANSAGAWRSHGAGSISGPDNNGWLLARLKLPQTASADQIRMYGLRFTYTIAARKSVV